MTDCTLSRFEFQAPGRRRIVAEFNGGEIVSDAGATLLHQVEQSFGIVRGFAACFDLNSAFDV